MRVIRASGGNLTVCTYNCKYDADCHGYRGMNCPQKEHYVYAQETMPG